MAVQGIGDYPNQPDHIVKGVAIGDTIRWEVRIPIGASGATGTLSGPYPNGFACAKNTTGVYDCTGIPLTVAKGRFTFGLESAAITVADVVVTAYDNTAGTMTFKTVLGSATPVQPASGDAVVIRFSGERY
jgi:hypothetical protein